MEGENVYTSKLDTRSGIVVLGNEANGVFRRD